MFKKENRYVLIVAILAALGGLLYGFDTGIISGALLFIEPEFHLTPSMQGIVVSSLLIGSMVGALMSGPLSDRYGRRNIVAFAAIVFVIGSLLAWHSANTGILITARVILGYAVGITSVIVPLYLSEMAPAKYRGFLVAMNQLMITVGILAAYLINYAFAESGNWRLMMGIGVLPAAVLFIGMFLVPESPRWLMQHNRGKKASEVLKRLRQTDDIESEIKEIEEANKLKSTSAGVKDLLDPKYRKLLLIGMGVTFFGQAVGINSIIYFAPSILSATGLGGSASILATVGIGIVNVIMTMVGMAFVDKFGRRPLLLGGLTVLFISLAVLGITFLLGSQSWVHYIQVGALFMYIAAYGISVGIANYVVPSEIFPIKIRGSAMSASVFVQWGTNFIISLVFLNVLDFAGGAATFGIFAAIVIMYILFTAYIIPETKGRSLEEIEFTLRDENRKSKQIS
ncbi:sugar porter family MFS transporter [Priestia megaterium]